MKNLQEEIKRAKELMGLSEGLNLPKNTPENWFKLILMRTTGPHTTPDIPNAFFFELDGKVIFEYYPRSEYFVVDCYTIWTFFKTKFNMDYDEIRILIKRMVEDYYKLDFVTLGCNRMSIQYISKDFNSPKLTPESWFRPILMRTTGPHTSPDRPNSLYYKLNGKVIFEYNTKSNTFWVDYYKIWLFLKMRFKMNDEEIEALIKRMVEDYYKLESVKPYRLFTITDDLVEEHYKLESVRPRFTKKLIGLSEGLNLPKNTPENWFRTILYKTKGPYKNSKYPDKLFYKLNGKVIFKYNTETNTFWVDYYYIWSYFITKFNMKYREIEALIKRMVEEHYKLESVEPVPF
jgi:hypothetical protein